MGLRSVLWKKFVYGFAIGVTFVGIVYGFAIGITFVGIVYGFAVGKPHWQPPPHL